MRFRRNWVSNYPVLVLAIKLTQNLIYGGLIMYNIYQIKISDEITDFVNSDGEGHGSASVKFPIYGARLDLMHGGEESYAPYMFRYFTKVCSIKREGGLGNENGAYVIDNLEEIFKAMNGYYFDEDTGEDFVSDSHIVDFGMRSGTRKDGTEWSCRDYHSLSVGDIVEDVEKGTFHMVDKWGFKDIEIESKVA